MEAIDTNRNGTLSASEIQNAAKALRKLDRNQDGTLTRDETGRGLGRPGRRPGRSRRDPEGSSLRGRTLPGSEAERKILAALQELEGKRRGNMNVSRDDGPTRSTPHA